MNEPLVREPRRAVIYLLWNERGTVPDYIPYALRALRPFAERILVVINGELDTPGRAALLPVADEVLVRENQGLDVAAYSAALDHLGNELEAFDELILMNYTWYGPVGDFAPVFTRMAARDVDFWGMTDHAEVVPNPITGRGVMARHLQSHWIAVRRRMFLSDDWRHYWASMPSIRSYDDSVLHHESRFTEHFAELGYSWDVAFSTECYGVDHPALVAAERLVLDGCPLVKRRLLFHDPIYLDREAVVGNRVVQRAQEAGYPVDLIWRDIVRVAPPRVLNANASLLEILPSRAEPGAVTAAARLRVVAVVHVFYTDMTDEILDRLGTLPAGYDLVITTSEKEKADEIGAVLAAREDDGYAALDIRVVASNRGRDVGAFFVSCADVMTSAAYDLVVKVHSKKTVQVGATAGEFFKRQQFDNLLESPGYTANLLALFARNPELGLVVPPMIHTGFPTLGNAWFTNREATAELAEELGIRVPLDQRSPVAAYGAMWVARPEAFALLFSREWSFEDYLPETEHRDGSLAHVQERIVAYAAAELGYQTRTVMNARYAAESHVRLEYKADAAYRFGPGFVSSGGGGTGLHARADFAKHYLLTFHPRFAAWLRRLKRAR